MMEVKKLTVIKKCGLRLDVNINLSWRFMVSINRESNLVTLDISHTNGADRTVAVARFTEVTDFFVS